MRFFIFVFLFVATATAFADDASQNPHNNALPDNGVISIASPYSVELTAARLEKVLREKGMTVFRRVDHSAGARAVDLKLRPTVLMIFGNPKVGTGLMQCAQTAAIDLPQKALIWQDKDDKVWLSYNDVRYIASRHGISDCNIVLNKISKALAAFADATVAP